MKYIRFRVWVLFAVLAAVLIFLFRWAASQNDIYRNENPVTNRAVLEHYPELYQHLYTRSARQLRPFLTHPDDTVRAQAWRGLASTPVDSIERYLPLAREQNSAEAWFAISKHELSAQQLRELEKQWGLPKELKTGIARVLGQQGDPESLDFLLSKLDTDISAEKHYALALSRLITKYKITPQEQIQVIRKAVSLDDEQLTRTYCYGWYRGAKTSLEPAARDTLMSHWRLQGIGIGWPVDQFVNKLLPERTTYLITNFYNNEQKLDQRVTLAVELAKSLGGLELNKENALAAKILLIHRNAHVRRITLQSLKGKLKPGGNLYEYITRAMVADTSRSPGVWLQTLETIAGEDPALARKYDKDIDRIVKNNIYLLPQALDVY